VTASETPPAPGPPAGSRPDRPPPVDLRLLILEVAGMFLIIALVLFLAAGTIAWVAGWVFLVLFFGFVVALSVWLLRHDPGLLTERLTGIGSAGQNTWDKVFFGLANMLFLAWLIVMPLDAVRFGWSQMPVALQVAGAALVLASFVLFFLIFRENAYLSPAVRIQGDRGQTVVSTGPYRYVRHPMYATAALFLAGVSLLLGSWYGLLVALLLVVGVAFRAVQEERVLRAELPGYDAYMARVRYRLVPHVW
jgi:protein-S-isoprenylcysteine O-methyltransferase Ste14